MSGFDLTRRARRDLVEIGVYGAEHWGYERSELYVSEFYTVFQWLVDERSVGRRCERIRPGLWRIEHASHVVFSGGFRAVFSSAGFCISGSFRTCTR